MANIDFRRPETSNALGLQESTYFSPPLLQSSNILPNTIVLDKFLYLQNRAKFRIHFSSTHYYIYGLNIFDIHWSERLDSLEW